MVRFYANAAALVRVWHPLRQMMRSDADDPILGSRNPRQFYEGNAELN